ncbi:hypothetical protein ACP70R_016626 [Stipagrostis hirtigluma subsp. patula]
MGYQGATRSENMTTRVQKHDFAPEFMAKPWFVQFSANPGPTRAFLNPFDGSSYTAVIPAAQGKRCLGWHGEWLLMLDDVTMECFLLHLASQHKVYLPPLLELPGSDESFVFALSSEAAPPDCTVVLSVREDRWLQYCRPGDKEWGRLSVFEGMDSDDDLVEFDSLSGAIVGHGGKVHVTTRRDIVVVVDATSKTPRVESNYIMLSPTCPLHHWIGRHLVVSCGDIFYVRLYLQPYGRRHRKVVNVDIHVKEHCKDSWESVESIGDRAIFIGGHNSCVVTSTAGARLEPNRIHALGLPHDGTFRFEQESSTDNGDVVSSEGGAEPGEDNGDETKSRQAVPSTLWSSLPADLLELIVQKVSFLDSLRLQAVCRGWSRLASKPIQNAKSPLLLIAQGRTEASLITFDPMTGKKYELGVYISSRDPEPQVLRCSRHGWVLITEGEYCLFLMNPLKGLVLHLPPMDNHFFNGITFLSSPGSPDFMVVCVSDWRGLGTTTVRTWQPKNEDWIVTEFEYDVSFPMAYHNPVLFEDELYCLGRDGSLGVFNPSNMTWKVLAKPEPIYDDIEMEQNEHCCLVEWTGQLIAIFTAPRGEPIRMFKLDRSQMAWLELDDLAGAVLFLDSRDALARPAAREHLGNKIYLQSFTEDDGAALATCYSLETRQYCPAFYGKTEPINAVWFEPNLQDFKGAACTTQLGFL